MDLQAALDAKEHRQDDIINVDEPHVQLVLVSMAQELFAFNGQHIQEIIAQTNLYHLPGCPSSMEGVINLRGSIESVIRLHGLLHLHENNATDEQSRILMAKTDQLRTGIRVDAMLDVLDMVVSNIQPKPTGLPAHLDSFVLGVFTYQQQPVVYLDLERILSHYASSLT